MSEATSTVHAKDRRKAPSRPGLLPRRASDGPISDWRPRTWASRARDVDHSGTGEGSFDSVRPDGQAGRQSVEVLGFLIDLGDLESEYRLHHLADDAAQSRIAYLLWLISSLTLIYFDYLVLGPSRELAAMVAVRLIYTCTIIAAIMFMRRVTNVRTYEWMTLGISLVMAAYVYAINASRPPDYFANFVLDILFPLSMFLVIPNRLLFSTISACGFFAFDLVSLFIDRQGVPPMFRNVVVVSNVLAIILGFLVAARVNSFRRRAYRLYRDEISSRRLIERIASIDDLTGSLTRRSFLGALEHELLRSRRFGRALTVIVMDLDAFKLVNDSHGHHAGDELLREFAATVSALKREIDVFGRLGGEEFCLMLPETPLGGAALVAERIRESWASLKLPFEGAILGSTVSIGVATLRDTDEDYHSLLRRADGFLYEAKRAGRNRVVVEDGIGPDAKATDDYPSTDSATSGDMTGASPRFSSS